MNLRCSLVMRLVAITFLLLPSDVTYAGIESGCVATDTVINANLCNNDTIFVNGKIYTNTGYYTDTLNNTAGCDSVIRLTVKRIPEVTLTWDSLMLADIVFLGIPDQESQFYYMCLTHVPGQFDMLGGTPYGGIYQGRGISNNTFYRNLVVNPYANVWDTISYTFVDTNGCIASASSIVGFAVCVDVNSITDDRHISVFPNPVTDRLNISADGLEPEHVTVYDMHGRIIYSTSFKQELDVHALANGVYFVEVESNGPVIRQRFVKM